MLSEPRILPSALTHGITDQSIRHATRNVMRRVDFDDRLTLLIGPDISAELLEVIVADLETEEARIIHAMRLRPNFYQYL